MPYTPPEKSSITVSQMDDTLDDVTFISRRYGDIGTSISIEGPVNMCLDQILISPAKEFTGCGVGLNFQRTSKHDYHMGSHFVISAEDERRLVEWLHVNEARYFIETEEFMQESYADSGRRGSCAGCEKYFKNGVTWAVTIHQDAEPDLHFCSENCFENSYVLED